MKRITKAVFVALVILPCAMIMSGCFLFGTRTEPYFRYDWGTPTSQLMLPGEYKLMGIQRGNNFSDTSHLDPSQHDGNIMVTGNRLYVFPVFPSVIHTFYSLNTVPKQANLFHVMPHGSWQSCVIGEIGNSSRSNHQYVKYDPTGIIRLYNFRNGVMNDGKNKPISIHIWELQS